MADFLAEFAIPAFDVVTSDIAPNLSGVRDVDRENVKDLYEAAVRVVKEGLKQGGSFLIKVFVSPEFKDMTSRPQTDFFESDRFQAESFQGCKR